MQDSDLAEQHQHQAGETDDGDPQQRVRNDQRVDHAGFPCRRARAALAIATSNAVWSSASVTSSALAVSASSQTSARPPVGQRRQQQQADERDVAREQAGAERAGAARAAAAAIDVAPPANQVDRDGAAVAEEQDRPGAARGRRETGQQTPDADGELAGCEQAREQRRPRRRSDPVAGQRRAKAVRVAQLVPRRGEKEQRRRRLQRALEHRVADPGGGHGREPEGGRNGAFRTTLVMLPVKTRPRNSPVSAS